MTFEGEEGAGHWKMKGRSREEHFREKELLWGHPEEREPGLPEEQKSNKYEV